LPTLALGSADKIVLIVPGNVTLTAPISIAAGGNLVIISSGDIIVDSNVGTAATHTTSDIQGIFVAGRDFLTGNGAIDKYVAIRGNVVAVRNIDMSLRNPGGVGPMHYFEFDPGLIVNFPKGVSRTQRVLEEVSP
jgi:hypothetical protein